jgi:hypothetical protein
VQSAFVDCCKEAERKERQVYCAVFVICVTCKTILQISMFPDILLLLGFTKYVKKLVNSMV